MVRFDPLAHRRSQTVQVSEWVVAYLGGADRNIDALFVDHDGCRPESTGEFRHVRIRGEDGMWTGRVRPMTSEQSDPPGPQFLVAPIGVEIVGDLHDGDVRMEISEPGCSQGSGNRLPRSRVDEHDELFALSCGTIDEPRMPEMWRMESAHDETGGKQRL